MRIYAEKGQQNILFEFTERKFDNKINSFLKYSKTFTKKFFRRKNKPTGCYIIYTWGYKSKEPGIQFTTHVFPPSQNLTLTNVLKWAVSDMEVKHDNYIEKSDPEGEGIFYLRAIDINFIYT